jgi:hypothetical protein
MLKVVWIPAYAGMMVAAGMTVLTLKWHFRLPCNEVLILVSA